MPNDIFLSRLRMDAAAVVNPYDLHRLLWTAFPGMPDASRPYLFRVLRSRGDAAREVVMLSTQRPARPRDSRVGLVDCRAVSPAFRAGQRLRFEVSANPVKRLAGSGERVPLIRDEERLAWLARRLAGAAEVEAARVAATERLYFRKPGMPPGKIEAVLFSGVLRVQDPARLLEALRTGVGPAKSFGCGLLLLARA
jgi:CRISPR system Cascade subunit CasE